MTVYLPEKDYALPNVDLLTLLFDNTLCLAQEDTIIHSEAADPSNNFTKSQAREYTKRIAYHLRQSFDIGRRGPGEDVVVCISSGQVLLPAIFLAVIAAGGVYSAASSTFTAHELARQVKQGSANLIITSSDCRDVAIKSAELCGVPLSRVLIFESMSHRRILQSVSGSLNIFAETANSNELLEWERITDPEVLERRTVCLLYSSGTTGVPKGVNISNLNLVSEGVIFLFQFEEYIARRKARASSYNFTYRTIAHLPAAHIAGCQGYFVNPMLTGGTTYWITKFSFPKFLEYNKKHCISTFFTVPPIYLMIAKSPLVTDQLKTVKHCVTGAAPMGPELMALASKKLGCNITQTWGLTETTGSMTAMPWDQYDETGSVSPLLPNCRMRIVDADDNDVFEGDEGEYLVKGPNVTTGYFKDEKATRESFTPDGWFRTGDIGIRKDGKFYVVDRKKVGENICVTAEYADRNRSSSNIKVYKLRQLRLKHCCSHTIISTTLPSLVC